MSVQYLQTCRLTSCTTAMSYSTVSVNLTMDLPILHDLQLELANRYNRKLNSRLLNGKGSPKL